MPNERPTEAEIRDRAYQLYIQRGGATSSPVDPLEDWLRAEQELRAHTGTPSSPPSPPVLKVAAKNGAASVTPPSPVAEAVAAPAAPKRAKRAAK